MSEADVGGVAATWRRLHPVTRGATLLAAALGVETLALLAYLASAPVAVTAPRYLAYPFVWLNAGLLAVWWVRPNPGASRRRRGAAAVLAVGYFVALCAIAGSVALAPASGVAVYWLLPPGWGPLVVADVGPLRIAPIPFRVGGYAALAYLAYAALTDTRLTPAGALVGAFSCVSCTLPLAAAVVSGVAGGAAGASTALAYSYDLATGVYLAALALLAWRPTVGLVARWR